MFIPIPSSVLLKPMQKNSSCPCTSNPLISKCCLQKQKHPNWKKPSFPSLYTHKFESSQTNHGVLRTLRMVRRTSCLTLLWTDTHHLLCIIILGPHRYLLTLSQHLVHRARHRICGLLWCPCF